MKLINSSPFPGIDYESVDPQEQEFHVVAVRATFAIPSSGPVEAAESQCPLVLTDESCTHRRPTTPSQVRRLYVPALELAQLTKEDHDFRVELIHDGVAFSGHLPPMTNCSANFDLVNSSSRVNQFIAQAKEAGYLS